MNSDKLNFRYFVDMRTGAFIFVTIDGIGWPPDGYPVLELSADDVKTFFNSEDE